MTGGSLSKWTISYFAVGIAWLFGAEGLMIGGFGYPVTDLASPDTLVLVHMVAIGWLSMAICGALLQFVPVLVARPLFSEGLAFPALALLTLGLAVLLAGFLALGGRLPPWLWLLPFGVVLLIAGFGLVAFNLGLTLCRARPLPVAARFVVVGLASLCVTAAFGGIFACALAGSATSLFLTVLASGVPLHAIAGLGGWLTLTAMGVSYRLLSMFMLSPDLDERKSLATLLAGASTVVIAVGIGLVAVMTARGWNVVFPLVTASAISTLALYGRDVVTLYRSRKRRALELNMRMAVWSFASLAAAAALGACLAATTSFAANVGAFVFLIAFGWLSGLILAKLYKIVAFLTWLETYGPVMGRTATPRVQDLVAEPRASKWFVTYFVAVWSATALLLAGAPFAFRIAALAMTVATVGIVLELVRARRLVEVAESLRLPQGTSVPRLLFSRN
jgi:hypothetical protein